MIEYFTPADLQEALDLMASSKGQALVIAGGTDMLLDLSRRKKCPQLLIDITRIPGLNHIQVETDCVEVGAAVTFATIKQHPFFRQQVHALTDAARSVGAAGIQTTATWVGNLVQAMPAADGAIVALALEAEVWVSGAVDLFITLKCQGLEWTRRSGVSRKRPVFLYLCLRLQREDIDSAVAE